MNHPDVQVLEMDATKDKLPQSQILISHAYYARFFIHALEENYLIKFFSNLSKTMKCSDYFFAEYRTKKTKTYMKTPEHFRKFYKRSFIKSLPKNGFKCIYRWRKRFFNGKMMMQALVDKFLLKAEF